MSFGTVDSHQDASRNGSSDEGVKGIDNTVTIIHLKLGALKTGSLT